VKGGGTAGELERWTWQSLQSKWIHRWFQIARNVRPLTDGLFQQQLRDIPRIVCGVVITHHARYADGAFHQNQQLARQRVQLLNTQLPGEFKRVIEQLLLLMPGNPANRIVRIPDLTSGVDERTAAVIFRLKPTLEYGEQAQDARLGAIGFVTFLLEPGQPADVARVAERIGSR